MWAEFQVIATIFSEEEELSSTHFYPYDFYDLCVIDNILNCVEFKVNNLKLGLNQNTNVAEFGTVRSVNSNFIQVQHHDFHFFSTGLQHRL